MANDKREFGELSEPRMALRAAGSIDDLIDFLKGKTDKVATLDEIGEAIAAGWAGEMEGTSPAAAIF